MGCGSSRPTDPWNAAATGCVAALAQWVDNEGTVNAIDAARGRGSLLHAAAGSDQVECLKLLLKCGANVDVSTPELGTPLHVAAASGAGNAVALLLANGASTSARLNSATPAEVAQRAGYPATAGLIRMAQEGAQAPESAGSRSTDRGSASQQQAQQQSQQQAQQQQRLSAATQHRAALAQQQAQQAARLREIHKQLTAIDPQLQQLPALDGGRRSASDPPSNGQLAAPPPQGPPHSFHLPAQGPGPRLSPSTGLRSRQPSVPPVSAWQQPPTDAELEALLARAQHQPAPHARSTPPSSTHSERGARPATPGPPDSSPQPRSPSAAGAVVSPFAQQQQGDGVGPGALVAAGEAAAGARVATPPSPTLAGNGGGGGSFVAVRPQPSLPRINSDESLGALDGGLHRASSADGDHSGSQDSSAGNSLVNDPLLEFVRKAMLSKAPSNLNASSPFATLAAAAAAEQQPQPGAPAQLASTQGPGTRGGGAAPAGAGAGPAQAGTPTQGVTPSRGASMDLAPRDRSISTQPSRGSGSLSLSVDIRPWEIQFEDLDLQKTIGEGSFGKVYVAKWHETLVAVKVLLDVEEAQRAAGPDAAWTLSNPILFNLQKECGLMASLRHPNVVQFMGVSALPPAMVTEYCAKGSLADVLKAANVSKQKALQLPWLRRLNMALDAAKGMLYLHKRGVVHRDLKSPNLLVESTWKVKVADFNLSKIVEDTGSGRSTIANMNPRWLAPEILNGEPATTASDVFSWGVVMWEILTFQLPWPHVSPWGLVGRLMDGMRLKVPARDELPGPDNNRFAGLEEYIALMERCWAQAPEERPDFEEVIRQLRRLLELQARAVGN